jgi:AraC family transcriptional regulator
MAAPPRDHIVITTTREPSAYVRQSRGGKTHEGPARPGESIIIPGGEPTWWDGVLPAHLRVALATSLVAEAAADVYGARASRLSVEHVMRTADPVLARLAELTVAELRTPDHPAPAADGRLAGDGGGGAPAAGVYRPRRAPHGTARAGPRWRPARD